MNDETNGPTKKIGITGQNGFVGYHLYQTLNLMSDNFDVVDFDRSYFEDETALDEFVSSCDVIVHLAALNRHNDPEVIYKTNVGLVNKLIGALIRTNSTPHVLISSSTQEDKENLYGKSKKLCRENFSKWANDCNAKFSGLVIPNVFGPFGNPFYNSVVATFCHQVSHDIPTSIEVDDEVKLIYVAELVSEFIKCIKNEVNEHEIKVPFTHTITVSSILEKLKHYKAEYQDKGRLPLIENKFEHNLFNTYRCYMPIADCFPFKYVQHSDNRGSFTELGRMGIPGQFSYSVTVPGVTRGNHFHTRKIERFAVIKGTALIQLRRIGTDNVLNFELNGHEPAFVDMPIWFTHNIRNVGLDELVTVFWIDEPYNPEDPDTYYVPVEQE